MAEKRLALVDVDDLWCREQITEHLLPLKEAVQNFHVTAYSIPNLLGSVKELKQEFPWITFAIHGFEHSFAECRSWHADLAHALLSQALEMGYDPVFKAPQWIMDRETEEACERLGIVLHHHEQYEAGIPALLTYPGPLTRREKSRHAYIHTHIQRNPATDWIGNHPSFTAEHLGQFDEFLGPADLAVRIE